MTQPLPQLLRTYTSPTQGNPKALIVMLHGYGAEGADLIGLSQYWKAAAPEAEFLAPDAPFPCEGNPYGHQWFALPSLELSDLKLGVEQAFPIINRYLDEALEIRGLKDENLLLMGFSQGAMLAVYTALMRPQACAGVLGYSGIFTHDISLNTLSKPPLLLVHGDQDEVVPFQALSHSKEILGRLTGSVEAHICKGLGHSIDQEGLAVGSKFIQTVLKYNKSTNSHAAEGF